MLRTTLDMKFIRYLNLFERVAKVRARHCFCYNSTIIFLVPKQEVAKALGNGGKNIKKLSEILEKKVKVIEMPCVKEDIKKFIEAIIYPVKFKSIEVKDDCVIISAGMQSKATLIGRNKTRLKEMKNILNEHFGIKELKIT